MAEKEEQKMTLVEYLNSIGCESGNDDLFVLVNGNMTMEVSRRYLESPVWKDLLQCKVISHKSVFMANLGRSTLLIEIEEEYQ